MDKTTVFEKILSEAIVIINQTETNRYDKLKKICDLLDKNIDYYNWTGFYLVDKDNPRELVLDAFTGEPTEHTRIGFGKGICGQAADREDTYVVQDVAEADNYLSCSINVKSEIVVPIFKDGKVIGEIDIDSHQKNIFTEEDNEYLNKLCDMLSVLF